MFLGPLTRIDRRGRVAAPNQEVHMEQGIGLIVYPVHDLARAKELYRKLLGVEPYADAPYYVGFRVGNQEIGLDPNGHSKGLTGPVTYRTVTDIRATLQTLLEAGAQLQQQVTD